MQEVSSNWGKMLSRFLETCCFSLTNYCMYPCFVCQRTAGLAEKHAEEEGHSALTMKAEFEEDTKRAVAPVFQQPLLT